MGDDIQPLVIDIGTGSIKAGFAGEDAPKTVFPTIVGRPRFGSQTNHNTLVGHDALSSRGRLQLQCPIEQGLISDWDAMEKIWHHIFYNELRVDPTQHPVLLTTRPLCPKIQMEKMIQIMFETFGVPGMYVATQGMLSLFASGLKTGLAVCCGDSMSYSVPVFEGTVLSYATLWSDIGGCDVTEYLSEMLYSRGKSLSKLDDQGCVRDMKEKLGYVALDYDKELEHAKRSRDVCKKYEMPDGQVIEIGEERFECPELLFQPYLVDKDVNGIHEMANDSIKRSHVDTRKSLYENIVVSGGSTLFSGFVDRMSKEMISLAPRNMRIKVTSPSEIKHTDWFGGSILASLHQFQEMWISQLEYDEAGPTTVHRHLSLKTY